MKCPFCKAGIPVDGNKSIVRCPSCQCDIEVRKAKRMRLPDNEELDEEPFDLDQITQQVNEMMLSQPQDEDEKT